MATQRLTNVRGLSVASAAALCRLVSGIKENYQTVSPVLLTDDQSRWNFCRQIFKPTRRRRRLDTRHKLSLRTYEPAVQGVLPPPGGRRALSGRELLSPPGSLFD